MIDRGSDIQDLTFSVIYAIRHWMDVRPPRSTSTPIRAATPSLLVSRRSPWEPSALTAARTLVSLATGTFREEEDYFATSNSGEDSCGSYFESRTENISSCNSDTTVVQRGVISAKFSREIIDQSNDNQDSAENTSTTSTVSEHNSGGGTDSESNSEIELQEQEEVDTDKPMDDPSDDDDNDTTDEDDNMDTSTCSKIQYTTAVKKNFTYRAVSDFYF